MNTNEYYYAYHHIRVDSQLVHIFMYNVSRGASEQWSILNSSKKNVSRGASEQWSILKSSCI